MTNNPHLRRGWIEPISSTRLSASKDPGPVPQNREELRLFLPVNLKVLPLLRGSGEWYADPDAWQGTPAERRERSSNFYEWISQAPLSCREVSELCSPGAEFVIVGEHPMDGLEPGDVAARESDTGPPPPWEFRAVVVGSGLRVEYRTRVQHDRG